MRRFIFLFLFFSFCVSGFSLSTLAGKALKLDTGGDGTFASYTETDINQRVNIDYSDAVTSAVLSYSGSGTVWKSRTFSQLGLDPANVVTVAKSGGDYTSIQEAINTIHDASSTNTYAILIYPGTYEETVLGRSYVSLIGVDRQSCKIVADIDAGTEPQSVFRLYSFRHDVSLSNLTLINNHVHEGTSSEAQVSRCVYSNGPCYGMTINNCDLLSYGKNTIQWNSGDVLRINNCTVNGHYFVIDTVDTGKIYVNNSILTCNNDTFDDHACIKLQDEVHYTGCMFIDTYGTHCIFEGGDVDTDIYLTGCSEKNFQYLARTPTYSNLLTIYGRIETFGEITLEHSVGSPLGTIVFADRHLYNNTIFDNDLTVSGNTNIRTLTANGIMNLNNYVNFYNGDAEYYAFHWNSEGKLEFSGDGSTWDTNLYRSSANVLKTDDAFDANSLKIDGTEIIDSSGKMDADNVSLTTLGSPTYNDVQDWFNTTQSSGKISGGAITDNGDGTVTVAAGTGVIRATDSDTASAMMFNWNANSSLSLTDTSTNYIYVDYNSGTPIIAVTITKSDINNRSKFLLGKVWRNGTDVHIVSAGMIVTEPAKKILTYLTTRNGDVAYGSGLTVSDGGTLHFEVSAGTLLAGLTTVSVSSFDSSASTFRYWYNGAGGWTSSDDNVIDNTQYNDYGTGLASLSYNDYGCHWIYVHDDGDIQVVYGTANYTNLSKARDATAPGNLPPELDGFSVLLAKIIVKKSASELKEVYNVSDTYFQQGISDDFASPPAIGDVTPNEGYFTDLFCNYNFIVKRYSNDYGSPFFKFIKSRGTESSPAAVQSGDKLGYILARGYYDTSNDTSGAYIRFEATGNWSSTSTPADITLSTVKTGTTTMTDRVVIRNDGGIEFKTLSSPPANVAGTVYSDGTHLYFGDGSTWHQLDN